MKNIHKTPELLAPAGSAAAFYAAVDAGADAVYLGLGDFNARLRAKNFTVRDLAALIPYAHSKSVKVYVTLNTLVKQSEIKPALDILYQLDMLGADAVIAADIGLMKLAAGNFPKLRIHGSTQAAVHNSSGAAFMQTLGAKRVVLARELSLDEIRETVKKSPVETEVFIHGALCYSISGLCLASSFIGGASGNRGRCTQVCRRKFRCIRAKEYDIAIMPENGMAIQYGGHPAPTGRALTNDLCGQNVKIKTPKLKHNYYMSEDSDGYFFSPYDLEAISLIDKLADCGVASFKIEGRMKGAEYVSTVVKAYRAAMDSPDKSYQTAMDELRFDFGRGKTTFFLNGLRRDGNDGDTPTPIDPSRASGTGIFVGVIVGVDSGDDFCVDVEVDTKYISYGISIDKDDRIRIQPENGFEGIACRVASCLKCNDSDNKIKFCLSSADSGIKCNIGDYIFLIGKSEKAKYQSQIKSQIQNQSQIQIQNLKNQNMKGTRPLTRPALTNDLCSQNVKVNNNVKTNIKKSLLWFRADCAGWLEFLAASPCRRVIFDADIGEIELLIGSVGILKVWRSRLIVALPPFIEEARLGFWRGVIKKCLSAGVESFAVSNVGHFPLVKGAKFIVADAPLWCVNRFTQEYLKSYGVNMFIFSYEDEFLNIRNTCFPIGIVGIMPLYGKPPLFISRMPPAVDCNITVTDPHGNSFFVIKKNNLFYTLPQTPICLFAKRKKLSECGIENFLIDVSSQKPDYATVNKLVEGFKENIRIDNGSIFNFKAGLR